MRSTPFILTATMLSLPALPVRADVRIAWDGRSRQSLEAFTINAKEIRMRNYPRVHRLANGDLLLHFMDGKFGWNLFQQRSKDGGKTWSAPRYIRKSWFDKAANDNVAYCNPEMMQLRSGTLLLVYQRRNNRRSNDNEGIEVMRSSDNGETWSEPDWAFRGKNWEPSLLQTPTGEVQLLFTATFDGMCHVGLLRSRDEGKSWSPAPNVQNPTAGYLSRTTGKTPDGAPFSMDGMAVGTSLKNGKGIVYAAECDQTGKTITPLPVTPSIVWSAAANNWNYPDFQSPMPGPADRRWPVRADFRGYAPYLIQLDSGEVLVQANGKLGGVQGMWTFVGNDTAHDFHAASRPFGEKGFWGCVAQIGPDKILSGATSGPRGQEKILLMSGYLNRPLDASSRATARNEWFIGDASQAQGRLSATAVKNGLTLRFTALDDAICIGTPEQSDGFRLSWFGGMAKPIVRVTATAKGVGWLESRPAMGGNWKRVAAPIAVNAARSADGKGYNLTVTVPWAALGGASSTAAAHLELLNIDAQGQAPLVDGMPGEDAEKPSTWLSVKTGAATGTSGRASAKRAPISPSRRG